MTARALHRPQPACKSDMRAAARLADMDDAVAAAPASQTSRSRRRTSLPSSVKAATDSRQKKPLPGLPSASSPPPSSSSPPSANYVRSQVASPEVISSLIDQLSAISVSANDHFENLLVGYSNALPTSHPPSLRSHSASASLTAAHDATTAPYARDLTDAYQDDDACEPPVIRTAKPPSGLSPLTAPKKRDKPHSLSSYMGRNSCSSVSIHSAHSAHSVTSFGAISIEAAPPSKPHPASERSSVESKRSAKGHKSLMYMSSRERLRLKETERKRHTTQMPIDDAPASDDSPRKNPPPLFPYEDTIKEEPTSRDENKPFAAEASRFVARYSERSSSPRRLRLNLVDGPGAESASEVHAIPERASSLRHTGSPARKSKKSKSSQGSDQAELPKTTTPAAAATMTKTTTTTTTGTTNMSSAQDQPPQNDAESLMKEKLLMELEQEENEVAQRIRQLREQKMRRDLLATKQLPVEDNEGACPPLPTMPGVSVDPSPQPSPTSTVSSASGRRVQDSTKARKVLGISMHSATATAAEPLVAAEKQTGLLLPSKADIHDLDDAKVMVVPQTRALRHSRHRSLTLNDGEDLTPLPINYALALQKAEEESPPTPGFPPLCAKSPAVPGIGVASAKEGEANHSVPRRASSVTAVGRPANARRATSSGFVDTIKGHKHSSSVTSDSAVSVMSSMFHSASEEGIDRHRSMVVALPPSNSLQLQRRRTFNKKRWSHPDLPAKAEKAHNDKIDKAEASTAAGAQQKPTHSVSEERPTSADSIDIEVDNYLNSPRLSQKIRHPQTGRVISFSEVGDPDGFAVFVCVGMGLTRYVMAFYDQLAATLKLRLITPDRPGIGGSQVDPNGTPLSWPDDVLVICQALKITKFSILAHSAGAVYALATSLRMPQHIRGRVHLLAPWIPPSQMAPIGISQDSPPTQQLPRSQRFLRALPPSLLKVANSTFLSATSASLQRTGPKNSPKTRRKSIHPQPVDTQPSRPSLKDNRRESMMMMDQVLPNASSLTLNPTDPNYEDQQRMREALTQAERQRQHEFDERLTFAIWDRATTHANPATDLIVCLETKQAIGFRYEDINRPVVIHHGSKDSRVPVDNVRWLGKLMRKCEVRILEGEQHGLMASAQVMGNVLTEMASDWEDWTAVVQGKGDHRSLSRKRTAERLRTAMS